MYFIMTVENVPFFLRNILAPVIIMGLLSACGGGGSSSSNTPNQPPLANAGSDISTYGKKSVTLTPEASDSDGQVISVEWSQASTDSLQVNIKTDAYNQATFDLPDIYETTTLHFTLTVKDDDDAQSTDDVIVTVEPAEHSLALAIQGFGESIKITSQTNVTIGGAVSSDYPLKLLKVANHTTNSEVDATLGISDSDTWQADFTLAKGDNEIVITAVSADDTTVTLSTIVTYYPQVDFTTPLQFDIDILYVGANPSTITTTIGTGNVNSPVVKLLDESGKEVAELFDDGSLPDEIQGDGIFTARFSGAASAVGAICYRILVADSTSATYTSEKQCIWGAEPYTPEQVALSVQIADAVKASTDSSISDGESVQDAAQAALNTIQANTNIGAAGVSPDGGIWWVDENGILGVHHVIIEGSKSGSSRGVVAPAPTRKADFTPRYYVANKFNKAEKHLKSLYDNKRPLNAADTEENRIESSRAVIISPYINNPNAGDGDNFGETDDYFSVWQTIKNGNSCKLSADTEYINNGSVGVTLDSFKDFSLFGYIHLSTHGDNYFQGLKEKSWKPKWGPNDFRRGSLSVVAIYTGIKLPTKNGNYDITGYESDLQMKRLAIGPGGSLAVLPSFFRHYLTSVPNSLVAFSACRSMYNNSLANVLLAKGAGAVMGYDNYVGSKYAQNTTNTILKEMMDNDSTFGAAVTRAKNKHGANDGQSPPNAASLLTAGADDLKLPDGAFKNLDFEEGVLGVWSKDGDGRIVTQLGSTRPTGGNFTAIVSTGLGYTTQTGSIEQTACLANSVTKLNYNWNLFSEEFMEYCNSKFDDSFSVSICEVDSNNCARFSTSINTLCNAGGLTKSDISFDKGGVYNTGWRSGSLDISNLAGKRVNLTIYSSDVGDSIYDTAILVDDITVE